MSEPYLEVTYRHGRVVVAPNKEEIERAIYFRLGDLLNVDVDLIFYDTKVRTADQARLPLAPPPHLCRHLPVRPGAAARAHGRAASRRLDSWRNILAQLDTIKVIEYERGTARVRQTTELRSEVNELLRRLKLPPPPRLHRVSPTPTA